MNRRALAAVMLTLFAAIYLWFAWSLLGPFPLALRAAGMTVELALFAAILWLPHVFWNKDDEVTSGLDLAIQWVAFSAMGYLSFVLVLTLARDLASVLVPQPLHTREATALILGGSAVFFLIGMLNARGRVRHLHTEIPIEGLPEELDGLRIVQVSDLHIGPTIKRGFVENVVRLVNEADADLAVLTGDLVDGMVRDLEHDAAPLAMIRARLGKYYITGNHEYYWEPLPWIRHFEERLGFGVLLNRHVVLEKNGAAFALAGIPDPAAAGAKLETPDAERAIHGAPEHAHPRILLCHQPGLAPVAEKAGFDLMISGHTHGGQFFPWTLLVSALLAFPHGLRKLGALRIYVSRGTGYWGPPVRLGALPEVSVLTLRRL